MTDTAYRMRGNWRPVVPISWGGLLVSGVLFVLVPTLLIVLIAYPSVGIGVGTGIILQYIIGQAHRIVSRSDPHPTETVGIRRDRYDRDIRSSE